MSKESSRPTRETGAAVTGPESNEHQSAGVKAGGTTIRRENDVLTFPTTKDRLRRPGLPLKRVLIRIPEPFND